ncbi:Rpn family recombination-promoting nuclease/putative transposase [Aliibacillus thermotolerans]|uniref:Rpn family recombination-promoting nuclease/putative transposase n=1 Tax=Aliibacillus thermotolerans TaxID=1834418 RepID=A0ABW0UB12_9BACI|nr:Rpn family recombination-promoting nuclease/putative transposase [Aliibacillus thermotolerans]MDA3128772.1 Rpn family recombination-promoting nuclease/putative transposase [Aliibacillus thermotolerans]
MEIQNPHDKFFKETLGNVETAKDFIVHYLPEHILKVVDVNTLEVQKDSFINKELEENFSDLLFKVNICNKEGYLYLLFEHKSYLDRGISFQLLKYMVEIWEAKRNKEHTNELPIIIPLVIYHGKKNWNIPSNLGDILNGYDELPERLKGYVPNFEFLLYDISRHSDEEIKGTAQLKILLTLFRDLNTGDVQKQNEAIFRSIHYLNELENKQTAVGYLETLMRYIFTVARDFTTEDMEQMIHEIETTQLEGSEVVMTLADILRKEGIEKGIDIGETKALSNMAIIQLTSKFGALPKELKNEIAKADKETLQVILMNIFNLESIDDVKRYLH